MTETQPNMTAGSIVAREIVAGLISVVMPMRNCEAFVREALESILSQNNVALEVVVVDDGSTDRSAEVVRAIDDPRIRLIPGPQQGIAAALNAGLAAARGEYFARCDADDFYAKDRLAGQKQLLESRPDVGAVCGIYNHVTDKGRHITDQTPSRTAESISHELKSGAGRTHLCTFLVRMKHLRELGGFRPYFIGTEDADFQLRLGEVCDVWYEPRLCYHYRLHGSSITHTQPSAERQFLEKMAREFQKQRLATGQDDLQRGSPPPIPQGLSHKARETDDQIQAILLGAAWKEHRAGQKANAIRTGFQGCLKAPANLSAWKSLVALIIKKPGPTLGHSN